MSFQPERLRTNAMDMRKNPNGRALRKNIKTIEDELRIAAKILDWEIGDLWGHVGARLPGDRGIAVKMFRRPEQGNKDWLVHFDFSLKKLSGVGTIPREALSIRKFSKPGPMSMRRFI